MNNTAKLPSAAEFIAFWNDQAIFRWRQLAFLVPYLGGLALYSIVAPLIDTAGRFYFPIVIVAVGYIILIPYICIRIYHKRYAKFIRCPQCGDWLGRDSSGAWNGPNPRWVSISQTGHCGNCGTRILATK